MKLFMKRWSMQTPVVIIIMSLIQEITLYTYSIDNTAPSPTETSSFHTADSLDSHHGDHSSTEIEEEDIDISLRQVSQLYIKLYI